MLYRSFYMLKVVGQSLMLHIGYATVRNCCRLDWTRIQCSVYCIRPRRRTAFALHSVPMSLRLLHIEMSVLISVQYLSYLWHCDLFSFFFFRWTLITIQSMWSWLKNPLTFPSEALSSIMRNPFPLLRHRLYFGLRESKVIHVFLDLLILPWATAFGSSTFFPALQNALRSHHKSV